MSTDNMDRSGAELFVDTLESYGVTHVFGNPGTTELPLMDAIADCDLQYVLGLHEDVAVGAAAGYANTRRYHSFHDEDVQPVGVANLHVTPGLAHGLGNLYAAMHAGSPLVVTAGTHSTDFKHNEPILSGDLVQMTDQFTKWSAEIEDIKALPTMLRRAFKVALTPPTGPVFLGLPLDVLLDETDIGHERLGTIPTPGTGSPEAIERAGSLLAGASEPVMVVGDGVAHAGPKAIEAATKLAEATGASVYGEILAGEVSFPVDHEQWISFLPPVDRIVANLLDTDTLLLVGCGSNTTLTKNEVGMVPDDCTCIQINDDSWELGKNHPADVALAGAPNRVLPEITRVVERNIDAAKRRKNVKRATEKKKAFMEKVGGMPPETQDRPVSKAELVEAMSSAAPDAYVVEEGVTSKGPLLTRWPLKQERYLGNRGSGLGFGLPASIGAAIAERQRNESVDVICFIGDGSYLYYPHALYTAARYDIDITVVVSDNQNYRILKDNTVTMMGGTHEDYDFVGMDLTPSIDLPTNARSQGASGRRVDSSDDIEMAIKDAVAEDGPSVVDVLVHD